MFIKLKINCAKQTCGKCLHKEQHSNAYPELYICNLFNEPLTVKNGDWRSGLSFYRLDKCKKVEI